MARGVSRIAEKSNATFQESSRLHEMAQERPDSSRPSCNPPPQTYGSSQAKIDGLSRRATRKRPLQVYEILFFKEESRTRKEKAPGKASREKLTLSPERKKEIEDEEKTRFKAANETEEEASYRAQVRYKLRTGGLLGSLKKGAVKFLKDATEGA